MRIVYCVHSLQVGGIESITVAKANALANLSGNKVWIITCCDPAPISAFPVYEKVCLCGIQHPNNKPFPWNLLQIYFGIRIELQNILQTIQPDIVVSTGGIDKWLIPSKKRTWSTIREIHFIHDYRRKESIPFPQKLVAVIGEALDYRFLTRNYDSIVVLTEEDRHAFWKDSMKVHVIPNMCRFNNTTVSNVNEKRILAVGRLAKVKNYSSLLRVARSVFDRFPDWRLDILGDGQERSAIEKEIYELSLSEHVFLRGDKEDVQSWMSNSSLLVLTSKLEGFAMVLVEAMACGLPVVSYDCPYGPRSIISDGIDGFLVPLGDEEALAGRICELLENENLRRSMGQAALIKSKRYHIDNILSLWTDLFEQLSNNRG